MNTPTNRQEAEERAAFVARKFAQAQAVLLAWGPIGLSYRRHGDTFRLGIDNGAGLVEAVIIGRPRQTKIVPEGRMQRIKRRGLEAVGIKVRSTDKRETAPPIDLTDAQLEEILAHWRRGESALNLKFARTE